jgi:tRNA threonylcarbamoyladenosine biosynthesis protein TsaE
VVAVALDLISTSAERTRSIGFALGELAHAGDVILLVGDLGVGKTCLAQGIALGLGIDDCVSSPSFVLVREYLGRLPLYHMDFYRLDDIEEMASLGLDDYLAGEGVCVVEWADKGLNVLTEEHLLVRMSHVGPTRRELRFHPSGRRYEGLASELRARKVVRGN